MREKSKSNLPHHFGVIYIDNPQNLPMMLNQIGTIGHFMGKIREKTGMQGSAAPAAGRIEKFDIEVQRAIDWWDKHLTVSPKLRR